MGKFDGETFLGGLLILFLGGRGGKRKRQGTVSRVGRWTTSDFKQTHFVLYYILCSGSFAAACRQVIANGGPDPRCPGHRRTVQDSTTDDLVHTFKTMEGLLLFVPPLTPRSSGYDVICYTSITCIVLGPS
jgi:hypothetical protein